MNSADTALSSWKINQSTKPDLGWTPPDTGYSYLFPSVTSTQNGQTVQGIRDAYFEDPFGLFGADQNHEIFWPADRFTILAHIIPARSGATGATAGMGGEFASEVDLNGASYNYGEGTYSHSAEFQSDCSQRRTFYFKLLDTFKLNPDPLSAPIK